MPRPTQAGGTDTAARILDSAERLVQVRGFNGFSYADVAGEVGVTKASLHYHFAGKAELGEALVDRYSEHFEGALDAIDERGGDAPARLWAYARIYSGVLRKGRLCLCGMLAADYETLSEPMRAAVRRFFERNEAWLEGVLAEGTAAGSLHYEGATDETAHALIGALEGAMLLARPYGGAERFESDAAKLLGGLAGMPSPSHAPQPTPLPSPRDHGPRGRPEATGRS